MRAWQQRFKTPQELETCINNGHDAGLREALWLNDWALKVFKPFMNPIQRDMMMEVMEWIESQIPYWIDDDYRELLSTERGRAWLDKVFWG